MELYQIEVTGDIAAKIRALAESGVFALKGGSCELHFDAQGNIAQVVTHSYKKLSPHLPNNQDESMMSLKY